MPSATEESFFNGGWQDDDERIDFYALFVLEDVSVDVIEDAIRRNMDCEDSNLWLADNFTNLPDLPDIELDVPVTGATKPPLDPHWQSPFQGKTMQDAADYLSRVPKPRKPLCKTYFAILDKTRYTEHDQILVCKVLEDGQVQSIPCAAAQISVFFCGHERGHWDQSMETWEECGRALMMPS